MWVCWRRKEDVDVESGAEVPKARGIKLLAIIHDDCLWEGKVIDDVFPHEVFYLGYSYHV